MNTETQILADALHHIVDQWPDSGAGVHAYWALTKAREERQYRELSEHVTDELANHDLQHPPEDE